MHEDLRGINSRGVHIATAFSISTEKGFNGLIMNCITSPTANYRFLEVEGKESLLWAKVYAEDESHGPMFWLTPWSCWYNSCNVALFASLPVISSHFSWIKMSSSVTSNSKYLGWNFVRFHNCISLLLFLQFVNIKKTAKFDSANQSKNHLKWLTKPVCPYVHMSPVDSIRAVLLDASCKLIMCPCPHIPRGWFCHLGIYSAMVISCLAVGCINKQSKDNMAFYLMPKYKERKQKWIVATYHKYWQLAKYTRRTTTWGRCYY